MMIGIIVDCTLRSFPMFWKILIMYIVIRFNQQLVYLIILHYGDPQNWVISQRTFLSHQLMPLHASTTTRYLSKALRMQIYLIFFSCSDHCSSFAVPLGSNRQVSRASAHPTHFTSVENFCIHHTFGVASIFIHLYTVSFLQLQRRISAEARKLVESSN